MYTITAVCINTAANNFMSYQRAKMNVETALSIEQEDIFSSTSLLRWTFTPEYKTLVMLEIHYSNKG